MLDDINAAIERQGGRWVKLRHTGDPHIDGEIVDVDARGKTFEGQKVLSRTSGEQRIEWIFTLQTSAHDDDDDTGIRKFAANESAQRAIADAVKESGRKLQHGARLQIAVTAEPATDRDQPTFKARYTPPTPVAAPATTADAPAAAVNPSDIFGDDEPF